MEINWLGHACFRLRGKNVTIVTDPYEESIGLKLGRVSADIVTISHNHYDHNNATAVAGNPKIISGPGEYEIGGVFITGVQTWHDAEGGAKRGRNTAYLIETRRPGRLPFGRPGARAYGAAGRGDEQRGRAAHTRGGHLHDQRHAGG